MTAPGGSAYSSRNRDTPVGMALGRLVAGWVGGRLRRPEPEPHLLSGATLHSPAWSREPLTGPYATALIASRSRAEWGAQR